MVPLGTPPVAILYTLVHRVHVLDRGPFTDIVSALAI
jgi:hypothetical protein